MTTLHNHIKDLITVTTEMRKDPTIDKEWLNRTASHLKSAYACSLLLSGILPAFSEKSNVGTGNGPTQPNNAAGCTCVAGARSRQCPVHGGK